MATSTILGIVLSRTNFGEADRILTMFSRENGKIRVLAKGSRKIKSKLAPHIEPFSVGSYFLAEGKTFYILAGAEAVEQNERLTSDIDLYRDASYVSELLSMTVYENVANPTLYDIAKEVYQKLPDYSNSTREIILRFFEYKLLESAGYVPNFHKCVKCDEKLKEADMYEGNFEGVKCEACADGEKKVSKNFVKAIRFFADNNLSSVLRINGIEKVNGELKRVQEPFLYDILPRTPKTREI